MLGCHSACISFDLCQAIVGFLFQGLPTVHLDKQQRLTLGLCLIKEPSLFVQLQTQHTNYYSLG